MNVYKSLFFCAICATASVLAAGCADKDKSEGAADAGKPEAAKADVAAPTDTEIADDAVVAEVDGDKLTYAEAIKTVKRVLGARGEPADQLDMTVKQMAPMALPQIAEQFVATALLKAEAAKKGFQATIADIDEAVSNIVANLPKDMTFEDILDKQGLSLEEARKEISEGLAINKLIDDVTKDLKAGEEAISKFYEENARYFEKPEQVEASHILIKLDGADATNETAKAAAKAKAEALRAQILAGTNFAELAAIHSDCPSKAQGGSLGFFRRGQMVKPFEDAAFALGTNEVSEVVETQFGFHVIKVTGKTPAGKTPLAEVRDQIEEHLSGEKKGEAIKKLIDDLKAKAKVFVNEALAKPQPPAVPEMSEEDLNAALEAVPASEPVAVESAPVEVKPAEEAKPADEVKPAEAPVAEEAK
ncbi:MAG: peptidylprolyl isomerase [Kiritimatiellae bacterium]|nr:peptidylprolyl isomerase [Kiritimatiellia bacterium]